MITDIQELLRSRVLVLDGAMGTQLQACGLKEADYRGARFAAHEHELAGCNDVLCLSRPDLVEAVHRRYIDAGADIITTDTFGANCFSLAAYGLEAYASEIARAGAAIARRAADEAAARRRRVLVAGSMGPTGLSATLSPDATDPAARAVSYDELFSAFREQAAALIEGGADFILAETSYDTLNAKALLAAVRSLDAPGRRVPLILSLTVSGPDGRLLSGQTVEAFVASTAFAAPDAIGMNCGTGARDMLPVIERLAAITPCPVIAYPNAGLPDEMGAYAETPGQMEHDVVPMLERRLVNIIGGCCGTTPEHIRRIAVLAKGAVPRQWEAPGHTLTLTGLEPLKVDREASLFVNVGERCNVAGSRRFLRLVKEKNYAEALRIARRQVEDGAQILDINMDDPMLDAPAEMEHFLRLLSAEPDIARVPLMIDTSDLRVALRALRSVQGRGVVNSISLKNGEQAFLDAARAIHALGAAMVVMAFDEEGQATTFERKTQVCARAYDLLTTRSGIPPEDIIFDPNILTIATGLPEHDLYARDFIRATAWIKQNLPHAKVSGGVSNLSFAFRGNNYLREAMHAVFLYHAIRAGMDMAIVNPSARVMYADIPGELRDILEDAILARRPAACARLTEWAAAHIPSKEAKTDSPAQADAWRAEPVEARLAHALTAGIDDHLEADLSEAVRSGAEPVSLIEGPLMDGMRRVGTLFGEGKMFLPQVVKSARVMSRAVQILQPALDAAQKKSAGAEAKKVIVATVRGDVHDIGKNIAAIVLRCNGYEVLDLGVMAEPQTIVEAALTEKPAAIGLSGLITPSLHEMAMTARALREAGVAVPLMVGGAATSPLHTALKIAPEYGGLVLHVRDASQNPLLLASLCGPDADAFAAQVRVEQERLRAGASRQGPDVEASAERVQVTKPSPAPKHPGRTVLAHVPVEVVAPYINWRQLLGAWRLPASLARLAETDCADCRASFIASLPEDKVPQALEASRLIADAKRMLAGLIAEDAPIIRAVVTLLPAHREGEDIVLGTRGLPMPRRPGGPSLADFLAPAGDYAGAFAITAGAGVGERIAALDEYNALLLDTLTHSLAEAGAEWLHEHVRRNLWGYAPGEALTKPELFAAAYRGIRPAVGYPSLPDQTLTHDLDALLNLSELGITLTPNGAMTPAATVCGLYLAAPQARYFLVGPLSEEAVADYARRRGITLERARALLNQ